MEGTRFLDRLKLSDREIKNAIRTAQAIANAEKEQLSYFVLKRVVAMTEQFEDDYIGVTIVERRYV